MSRPIDKLCAALLDIVKLGKSAPFAKRFQAVAPAIDDAFDLATIL